MDPERQHLEWVRQAQAILRQVRQLLLSPTPQSLEHSAPHLEAAAGCLKALEHALRAGAAPPRQSVLPELSELRRQVLLVQALLQQAGAFYVGWARLLAATLGGYTPQGEPAVPPAVRRLSMEG